jgi:hypothetical protein
MRESKTAQRRELDRLTAAYSGPITRERDAGRITVSCSRCHSRRTIATEFLLRFGVTCLRCGARMAAG